MGNRQGKEFAKTLGEREKRAREREDSRISSGGWQDMEKGDRETGELFQFKTQSIKKKVQKIVPKIKLQTENFPPLMVPPALMRRESSPGMNPEEIMQTPKPVLRACTGRQKRISVVTTCTGSPKKRPFCYVLFC